MSFYRILGKCVFYAATSCAINANWVFLGSSSFSVPPGKICWRHATFEPSGQFSIVPKLSIFDWHRCKFPRRNFHASKFEIMLAFELHTMQTRRTYLCLTTKQWATDMFTSCIVSLVNNARLGLPNTSDINLTSFVPAPSLLYLARAIFCNNMFHSTLI